VATDLLPGKAAFTLHEVFILIHDIYNLLLRNAQSVHIYLDKGGCSWYLPIEMLLTLLLLDF
jgi:hypothetical protein